MVGRRIVSSNCRTSEAVAKSTRREDTQCRAPCPRGGDHGEHRPSASGDMMAKPPFPIGLSRWSPWPPSGQGTPH
eukprot:1627620-Alexandrium_andersonii.AAC.1